MDHDATHPAQRVSKHEVPAGLLVPVARKQQVVLKSKVLQAACHRGEELLQQRALRLGEVRSSVWHSVIRIPTQVLRAPGGPRLGGCIQSFFFASTASTTTSTLRS